MDYKNVEIRSNSTASKTNPVEPKTQEKERATKVTSSEVTTKKKSEGRKLLNNFITGDAADVKNYIVGDVLIPAMKNLVSDAISNTVSMFLFGESSGPRTLGRTTSSGTNYTVYSRSDVRKPRSRTYSRDTLDIEEIEFSRRIEAEDVLDGLDNRLRRYREATVLDLYDLAGLECPNYRADKYGWTSLVGARVRQSGRGYILDLPEPEYLG